jgi:uncharacterized protein
VSSSRYVWQGLDDPSRVDQVNVTITELGMRAFGTTTSDAFATVWRLEVDAGWLTRRLEVSSRGFDWSRNLVLERSHAGIWTAHAAADGDPELPEPGLDDAHALKGAQDCDLGLCPLTNTMPIRRLGLLERDAAETPLVMAWVDVPSLEVIRSEQIYASAGPGRVLFRSGDFRAELEVDPDGIVTDYPGLATRQART